jgi:hypothetical protein
MSKNKKKKMSNSKKKKEQKEQRRKEKRRQIIDTMNFYLKRRRNMPKPKKGQLDVPSVTDKGVEAGKGLSVDDVIEYADCDGVGNCCIDRPLSVEPGDIFRILKNAEVSKAFGIKTTMDLYRKEILFKLYDEKTGVPVCFVRPVPMTKDENAPRACPFYVSKGSERSCMLGDDRLTQCRADPIMRVSELDAAGRICGWKYSTLTNTKCVGCPSSRPNRLREQSISSWLDVMGMSGDYGRYAETGMYILYSNWLKKLDANISIKRMATEFIFNWSAMGETGGPEDVADLIMSARIMTEKLVEEGWDGEISKEEKAEQKEVNQSGENKE